MIFINSVITAWRRVTGTTGAGEPVLSAITLPTNIPCELIDPSDTRVAQAQSTGVELYRLMRVFSASLRVAGVNPTPGDRVTVRLTRPGVGPEDGPIDLEVVGTRALGTDARVVEIAFGVRRDGQ